MTMVLVDAVRNAARGAERLLGRRSEAVRQFDEQHPMLKALRDRLEHYDEYIRGSGDAQRVGSRRNGEALTLDTAGLEIHSSPGGGPSGHVVQVRAIERAQDAKPKEVVYEVATRTVAVAARTLARGMLAEAGMLDDSHLEQCEMCADPYSI